MFGEIAWCSAIGHQFVGASTHRDVRRLHHEREAHRLDNHDVPDELFVLSSGIVGKGGTDNDNSSQKNAHDVRRDAQK